MAARLRLLILEDEPNDAELEVAELEAAGYDCQWEQVETRADFIARLDAPEYDLILSDYKLPRFDGLAALALVMERRIDIPFILVSGTLGEEQAIESLKAGATDYVLKTRLARLPSVVERAVREHRDRQRRKKAEEQLRMHQRLLAETQAVGAVGGWEFNIDTHQQIWTEETYRIHELDSTCTPDVATGINFYTPASLPIIKEAVREAIEQEKSFNLELEIVTAKGNLRNVHAIGKPDLAHRRVYGFFQDITERKQADAKRELLMAAINQASETIVITDADAVIQYVNPAFEHSTGYSREEAIGQNPRILQSGRQNAAFYQNMWTTLASGKNWEGRFVNKRKDGSFYTEQATISPVKNAEGKTTNYVGIKLDVTEDLIREEALRQSQKMETVGRLAGGLAHDFNNILQAITGFCEILMLEMEGCMAGHPPNCESHHADVGEIHRAALHAALLTRQLLTFSRKQPTDRKVVDLNSIFSTGKKMLSQVLGDDIVLKFDLEPTLPTVKADSSQMMQVAMNLLVNARDAISSKGQIAISTRQTTMTAADMAEHPQSRPGRFVCLAVADSGCGMTDAQMAHIFEPFYTTKQPGKGTGMGLAVVYGIVAEHGGWIAVSSTPGQGTVFNLYFPVYDEAANMENLTAKPDPFIGKRILLVEDDPVVRELTAEILQDVGYLVEAVEDATHAEGVFALKEGKFDLLFSDVLLPDGNGIELANLFVKQHPGCPVLLFSGSPDEHSHAEAVAGKGFHYMRKPFNLSKLLNEVDRAITGAVLAPKSDRRIVL